MARKPGLWVDKTINGLEHISTIIAGMLFLLNIVNIVAAVFTRYVMRNSFIWTAELSRFMMVWMVLIGAAAALKKDEHMKIVLLLKYLPGPLRKAVDILRHSIIIFVSLFMTIKGFSYGNSLWKIRTLGLGVPKSIPLFAVSLGMGLFLFMYVLLRITGKQESRSTHKGV